MYSEPHQNQLAAGGVGRGTASSFGDGNNFELFSYVPNAGRGGPSTSSSAFSSGFAMLKSRLVSIEKEMSHSGACGSNGRANANDGMMSIKQQKERREKEDEARAQRDKEQMMRAQREQQQQQQNQAANNTNNNNNNGNNNVIGFDDDDEEDDEMFQLVDLEALETRKQAVAAAQPQRPQQQHQQHQQPPPSQQPPPQQQQQTLPVAPSRAAMNDFCLPIALDGSGLDWVCEHGCALRECDRISLHFRALQPTLNMIIQRLDDDEYMMKNIERKNLEKKRKEAETIQAFLNNGGGGMVGGPEGPSIVPMNNNTENNINNNSSHQQNASYEYNNFQGNDFHNDFQRNNDNNNNNNMNHNMNNFNNDEFYHQHNDNNFNNGGDFQAEWDDDNSGDIIDMENLPKLGLGANGGHEAIPAVQCEMGRDIFHGRKGKND